MKKIITMAAVMAFALGAQAAASYLYWMLEPVEESMAFAYARILGVSDDGETAYLQVGGTGDPGGTLALNKDFPETGIELVAPYYSLIPDGIGWKNFYVELYNWEGGIIGVSQQAVYSDLLSQFVYSDMSVSATRTPYQFAASIPEPSGGVLLLLGFGAMALRRRKAVETVED